ncbi:MAG: cyclic nucleotide-binding domain-containing protein [Myxococcales bacterium]|nr:cyclic nucleotide-binding domain-containing protein [Myxococcales bacterium]
MLTANDRDSIARVPVFAALSPAAMALVGRLARRLELDGPTTIFEEGAPAREMVIVLEGELEVRKRGRNGGEAVLAVLRPGDVAGEMSLIDIQPRSAAVRSLGKAALVVLEHGDLATLYREDPAAYTVLVLNIAREISRRLRRVDLLLADVLLDLQDVWTDALAGVGGGKVA